MPFVTIKWVPRSKEKKVEMAKRVTEAIVRRTGVDPGLVNIVFEDMPRENFARAGVLASERKE